MEVLSVENRRPAHRSLSKMKQTVLFLLLLAQPWVVTGTHFRGAAIMMKPATGNTDKQMDIFFRISWRRNSAEGGYCDEDGIAQGNLIRGYSRLRCFDGCAGTIGYMNYICTDFSNTENWSFGIGNIQYNFSSADTEVTLTFSGGNWIAPFHGSWVVPISTSLLPRNDTGLINSTPQVMTAPVVRLQVGCNHTFPIAVTDPDGDKVRCRWAVGYTECGNACNKFPGAVLDQDTCRIKYYASRAGYAIAALMVEDFLLNSTPPLSSIGLQFVIHMYISEKSCLQVPVFVRPTSPDGACVPIPEGGTYNVSLVATSGGPGINISEFQTASPQGMVKGEIEMLNVQRSLFKVDMSWTPEQSEINQTRLFCFTAVNSIGQASEQRCIKLITGYDPLVLVSVHPNNVKLTPRELTWTLEFNKPIQRSSRPAFLRFTDAATNNVVYFLDTSRLAYMYDITISNNTVNISVHNMRFPERRSYYVNIDEGAFVGTEGCNPSVVSVTDNSSWTFSFPDSTPPLLAVSIFPASGYSPNGIMITWTSNEPFTSECFLMNFNGSEDKVNCENNTWTSQDNMTEGAYVLKVIAVDDANNNVTVTKRFEIDRTSPGLRVLHSPPNITGYSHSYFSLQCQNESCKFSYRQLPYDTRWRTTTYYYGPYSYFRYYLRDMYQSHGQQYTFEAIPYDRANNSGSMYSFTGLIDSRPPNITLTENATITCSSSNSSHFYPSVSDDTGLLGPVTYYDRRYPWRPCSLRRYWTAIDLAKNRATAQQEITIDGGVRIKFLPELIFLCDSSVPLPEVTVPLETASASSECYNVPSQVTLSLNDSVSPEYYPCPGTFLRNLTAQNICTGQAITATQVIVIKDRCPTNACGRNLALPRGQCVLGECVCNTNWYGEDCENLIYEPQINNATNSTIEEGLDYYYNSTLLQGSPPVTWQLIVGPTRMELDSLTGKVSWKRSVAGNHTIVVEASNAVGKHQIAWSLFVRATYRATLRPIGIVLFPRATRIALHGIVHFNNNSYIKNLLGSAVPVDIKIVKNGLTSTYRTYTEVDGSFAVNFVPPSVDYGHYSARASHPAHTEEPSEVHWDVLGFKYHPHTIYLNGEAISNFSKVYGNICTISNDGPKALTRLTMEVLHAETMKQQGLNVSLHFVNSSILPLFPSNSSISFSITVNSVRALSTVLTIKIHSQEGTERIVKAYLNIAQVYPQFDIKPKSVNLRLSRGTMKRVKVNITNIGRTPATETGVIIPPGNVLTIEGFSSATNDDVLNPGQSALLTMQASVEEEHALGDITGSFIIRSKETQAQVPFKITVSSDLLLNFTVKVENEFTYFANGNPPLGGAQVTLISLAREIILQQYTDNITGSTTFVNIREDQYELRVQAPVHLSIKRMVLPSPEQKRLLIFLERMAVIYSLSVTPVTIDDTYDITVQSDFETKVPMPVVTVSPNNVDLTPFESGFDDTIDFNVTNHGLIRTDNIRLQTPSDHPFLDFKTSSEDYGALEGESSIIIPVQVVRKVRVKRVARVVRLLFGANVIYQFMCGEWQFRIVPIILKSSHTDTTCTECDDTNDKYRPSNSWSSPTFPPCNICGGIPEITFNKYSVSFPSVCNKCIQKLFCLTPTPKFPGAKCIPLIAGGPGDVTGPDSIISAVKWIGCLLDLPWKSIVKSGKVPGLEKSKSRWKIFSKLTCAYDIVTHCLSDDAGDNGLNLSDLIADLIEAITPILTGIAFALEMLGHKVWLDVGDTTWIGLLINALLADEGHITPSPGYHNVGLITPNPGSHNVSLTTPSPGPSSVSFSTPTVYLPGFRIDEIFLPNGMDTDDVRRLIERLHNTRRSWSRGKFEPSYKYDNMASYNKVKQMWNVLHQYNEKAKVKGYDSYIDAYNHVANRVNKLQGWEDEGGVCAVVRVELQQQVALTREGFLAALEIENKQDNSLTEIFAEMILIDVESGETSTEKFAIGIPARSGDMTLGGNGSYALGSNGKGRVEWLIVPYSEAAPVSTLIYDVTGTLAYKSGSNAVEVPLLPSRISVKPDPSLAVHYFWEKNVEADDPFTNEIEKSIPFSLGVLIKNKGYGIARNVRISSGQPEIIENEKGLKISFRIIGSTLDDKSRQTSLDVIVGDLSPNETTTIRWWMVSSLQGQFKNYSATFRNVNPLCDEKLSLLDELEVHELIRNVRLYNVPRNRYDNILDFLVKKYQRATNYSNPAPYAVYDSANLMPYPVRLGNLSHESTHNLLSSASSASVVVSSFNFYSGWTYYTLTDDEMEYDLFDGEIVQVYKSTTYHGNVRIPLENVWLKQHSSGNSKYFSLHIFDFAISWYGVATYNITICASNCSVNGSQNVYSRFNDPINLIYTTNNSTAASYTSSPTTVTTDASTDFTLQPNDITTTPQSNDTSLFPFSTEEEVIGAVSVFLFAFASILGPFLLKGNAKQKL